jgi:uncharacterized PurR-regulated membrane protein YhhQ (DUF165 family)
LIDTFLILFLLCAGGAIEWNRFWDLFTQGFVFKMIIALIDTPIIYLCVLCVRNKFSLKINQELE